MKTFKAGLHRSLAFLFLFARSFRAKVIPCNILIHSILNRRTISTHLEGSKNPNPPNPVSNISLLCYLFQTNHTLGNNILWPSDLLQSDGHGIGQPQY